VERLEGGGGERENKIKRFSYFPPLSHTCLAQPCGPWWMVPWTVGTCMCEWDLQEKVALGGEELTSDKRNERKHGLFQTGQT